MRPQQRRTLCRRRLFAPPEGRFLPLESLPLTADLIIRLPDSFIIAFTLFLLIFRAIIASCASVSSSSFPAYANSRLYSWTPVW